MLWETPSLEDIVSISASHVQAMETMDDDAVWQQVGMHHVLLHNIGRKSGKEHKVALPTWNDPDGHRIVVASYAGAPGHPSWYLNIADRDANPRVKLRWQHGEFWSDHEILAEGAERDRIWDLLTADRDWYLKYQAKTDRTIALVRFPVTEVISER